MIRLTLLLCSTALILAACETHSGGLANGTTTALQAAACGPNTDTLAVIDVGSSGQTMQIACVATNTAGNSKLQNFTWLTEQTAGGSFEKVEVESDIDFGAAVLDPGDIFTPAFIQGHKAEFADLCTEAKKYSAEKLRAVATAAFRRAGNGRQTFNEFADACRAELDPGIQQFDAMVVSQRGEGILEYIGVSSEQGLPIAGNQIVWGIGSNSMQITVFDRNSANGGAYEVVESQFGADSFSHYVIDNIKGDDHPYDNTPNPMSLIEYKNSRDHAAARALQELDAKSAVKNAGLNDAYAIYGVGGTLKYLIDRGVRFVNLQNIGDTAIDRYDLEDGDLPGGPFAYQSVTNLALVYGYLSKLAPGKSVTKAPDAGVIDGLAAAADWNDIDPY